MKSYWIGIILLVAFLAGCQTPSQQSGSPSASTPPSSGGSPGSQSPPSTGGGQSGGTPDDGSSTPSGGGMPAPTGGQQPPGGTETAGSEGAPGPEGEVSEAGGGPSVDDLDEALDESLGTFDDMVLGTNAPEDTERGEDILGGLGTGKTAEEEEDDSPVFAEGDLGEDDSTLTEQTARAPTSSSTGTAPTGTTHSGPRGGGDDGGLAGAEVPDDVGDGSDDDIVARQLREAAMREKDPVLREKLWEEYRKYKNQGS